MSKIKTVKYVRGDNGKTHTNIQIDHVLCYKDSDILLVVMNNCDIIKVKISDFDELKEMTDLELQNVEVDLAGTLLKWNDYHLYITDLLTEAAAFGSLEKLDTIKIDTRPSESKVIFMCFYINVGNSSAQHIEETVTKSLEMMSPIREKYTAIFNSFDLFVIPVQGEQETKIEIFVL